MFAKAAIGLVGVGIVTMAVATPAILILILCMYGIPSSKVLQAVVIVIDLMWMGGGLIGRGLILLSAFLLGRNVL